MSLNIKEIIKQRLNLQSTQKTIIENFKIKDPSCFTDDDFTESYLKTLDRYKQDQLLIILAGGANIKRSRNYYFLS